MAVLLIASSSGNRRVYPPGIPHHLHEFRLRSFRRAHGRFANVVLMRQHPAGLPMTAAALALPRREPVTGLSCEGRASRWTVTYVVGAASDGAIDAAGGDQPCWRETSHPCPPGAVDTAEARLQKLVPRCRLNTS